MPGFTGGLADGPGPGMFGAWAARRGDPIDAYGGTDTLVGAQHASGTGSAFNAICVGGSGDIVAPAETATGTGEAFNVSTTGVQPDLVSFPGRTASPTSKAQPGPGFFGDFMARLAQAGGLAGGGGFVSEFVTATAQVATGLGEAFNAAPGVDNLVTFPGIFSGLGKSSPAPGFGSINQLPAPKGLGDPSASTTGAQVAAGTGTAYDATTTVSAGIGAATGTGAAYNATASNGAADAVAGTATGTGAAYGPTPSVSVSAGSAAGTGTAYNLTSTGSPTSDIAQGVGTAYNASVAIEVMATVATAFGIAYDPVLNFAFAITALGTGTAYDIARGTRQFQAPSAHNLPPVLPDSTPEQHRLYRFSHTRPEGINVYVYREGSPSATAHGRVTEDDPIAIYDSDGRATTDGWSDIETVFWGGRDPVDVSDEMADLLEAEGYSLA